MKRIQILLTVAIFVSLSMAREDRGPEIMARVPERSNSIIKMANLKRIKQFILKQGLSRTYSQMYNNNPYYGFANYNAYLNPDVGQKNINCERSKSDFNHLVIQTSAVPYRYWDIQPSENRKYLLIYQKSTIGRDALVNEVEDIFGQLLSEIDRKQ